MLQSITWYQFFCVVGGAIGLYYFGVLAYFYWQEIKALASGDLAVTQFFSFGNPALAFSRSDKSESAMGHALESASESSDDSLVGTVSDLVDEIKFVTTRNESLSKHEAESLLTDLLKKYPKLVGTHYQDTISLFIADSLTDRIGQMIDRKEVQRWWPTSELKKVATLFREKGKAVAIAMLVYMLLPLIEASAQDGNAGINEATMRVRSFFATGVNLTYAIGAIIGLIGAVKVYQKWNSGDQDTGKVAASWFGSCVFLVITATVLRSFFGV